MSPEPPVNILVRMPNWLGDCVMAMPALRHLSESMPRARLYLAGREPFRGLLGAQPGVAGFVAAPRSGFGGLVRGMGRAGTAVREAGVAGPIDLGILFTNSFSTAAWLWRAGARLRVGYNRDGRRLFLTHPVPCGGVESSWHFIRYYLWLAVSAETAMREAETVVPRQVNPMAEYLVPSIRVGEAARDEAAGLLAERGVGGRYAVIAPASAYGAVKDWPPERYRELIAGVRERFGMPVVITGGGGQADVCRGIADGMAGAVDVAGKTSMDGFAGLLAGASLFVGGDSGGAHVAGALGVPAVVIFGITNPSRTRPTGERVAWVGEGEERDVKLSTPEARERARAVLAAIAPETVLAAAEGVMHGRP